VVDGRGAQWRAEERRRKGTRKKKERERERKNGRRGPLDFMRDSI
jgi:hypothetical protein